MADAQGQGEENGDSIGNDEIGFIDHAGCTERAPTHGNNWESVVETGDKIFVYRLANWKGRKLGLVVGVFAGGWIYILFHDSSRAELLKLSQVAWTFDTRESDITP